MVPCLQIDPLCFDMLCTKSVANFNLLTVFVCVCIQEVKISNPDYIGVDKSLAAEDFRKRIALYETQYEPIDDDIDKHLSYIKIFNQGASFVINKIQGLNLKFFVCVMILKFINWCFVSVMK